jgi:hypothetical protein
LCVVRKKKRQTREWGFGFHLVRMTHDVPWAGPPMQLLGRPWAGPPTSQLCSFLLSVPLTKLFKPGKEVPLQQGL